MFPNVLALLLAASTPTPVRKSRRGSDVEPVLGPDRLAKGGFRALERRLTGALDAFLWPSGRPLWSYATVVEFTSDAVVYELEGTTFLVGYRDDGATIEIMGPSTQVEAAFVPVRKSGVTRVNGVDVGWAIGRLLFRAQAAALAKGAGHKYLRRIPTGNPKRPWRYVYTVGAVTQRHGGEHYAVGSKFQIKHGDKVGHFEIVGREGDKLTIRHDESGHQTTLTGAALEAMFRREHAHLVDAHRTRLKRNIEAAKKHGSTKQVKRLLDQAEAHGHRDLAKPATAAPPRDREKVIADIAAALKPLAGVKRWSQGARDRLYIEHSIPGQAAGRRQTGYLDLKTGAFTWAEHPANKRAGEVRDRIEAAVGDHVKDLKALPAPPPAAAPPRAKTFDQLKAEIEQAFDRLNFNGEVDADGCPIQPDVKAFAEKLLDEQEAVGNDYIMIQAFEQAVKRRKTAAAAPAPAPAAAPGATPEPPAAAPPAPPPPPAQIKPASAPKMTRILARERDWNARGNGTEEHRKIMLPDEAHFEWAADGEDVEGEWAARGQRASNRQVKQTVSVPVGSIVVAFDRNYRNYQPTGPATVTAGVVELKDDGNPKITWGSLSTRRSGGEMQVKTPSGEWVTI